MSPPATSRSNTPVRPAASLACCWPASSCLACAPFSDLASAGLGTLFLKFGRDDELESDRLGVEYATKAGWDPTGVPRFLETLSRLDALSERGIPNWLSTHPDPGSRVVKAQPIAERMAEGRTVDRHRDEYLRRVDGMAYGDDPAEGVVRGHQFLHPDMRIGIEFPEGWNVHNAPDQVVAQLDGEKALMVMQAAATARSASLADGATRHMRGLGFKLESGLLEQVGGRDAFVGVYTGKAKGVGEVRVRAAHVTIGRQVYMLAGVAPAADFPRVEPEFARALQSFRELSGSEAAAVRPNRLAVYVAKTGDSWQSIAQRAGTRPRAGDAPGADERFCRQRPAARRHCTQDRRRGLTAGSRGTYNRAGCGVWLAAFWRCSAWASPISPTST